MRKTAGVLAAVGLGLSLVSCSDPQETAIQRLSREGYEFNVNDYLRASASGDGLIVDLYVASGMAVDAPDAMGRTALLSASAAGRTDMAVKLLALGADPLVVDPDGRTPLIHAASLGNVSLVEALLKKGADPLAKDKSQWTALAAGAFKGHADVVALLAPLCRDSLDGALHLSSVGGNTKTVDVLLREGASVFARSKEQKTALMYAAANGNASTVKLLIRNGSNRFALDEEGATAAQLAASSGFPEIAQYLNASSNSDDATQEASRFVLNQVSLPVSAETTAIEDEQIEIISTAPANTVANLGPQASASPTQASASPKKKDSVMNRVKAYRPDPVRVTNPAKKSRRIEKVDGAASNRLIQTRKATAVSEKVSPKDAAVPRPRRLDGLTMQRSVATPVLEKEAQSIPSSFPPIRMYDYRESQLPVMLTGVDVPAGRLAYVRLLNRVDEVVTVSPGQTIPDTTLKVIDVQHHVVEGKLGQGQPRDVSRMILEDTEAMTRHLVVKDLPAMSNNVYALISLDEGAGEVLYDARSDDRFTADGGQEHFRILDVRPDQIVLLREDTGETLTIPRTTHHGSSSQ